MSKEEFYDEWKSRILLIPGLPLEKDTAASNEESLLGHQNLYSTQRSKVDKEIDQYGSYDYLDHKKSRVQDKVSGLNRFNSMNPGENSLTVSYVEEDENALREKLKNALQEEQYKNEKLKHHLGVNIDGSKFKGSMDAKSHSLSSLDGSKRFYQLYKVSDIFKSAFLKNPVDRKKALTNLFKYRRGASVLDSRQCHLYTPNETMSRFQEPAEYLKCVNCGKSMNSHQHLKFKVAISEKALLYQSRLTFYDKMIMDTDIVILLGTDLNAKNATLSNRENTLNMFLQQVSTCGMKVKDIVKMNYPTMKTNLYKKYLIMNCPLEEKDSFEDYIQHPEMHEGAMSFTRLTEV